MMMMCDILLSTWGWCSTIRDDDDVRHAAQSMRMMQYHQGWWCDILLSAWGWCSAIRDDDDDVIYCSTHEDDAVPLGMLLGDSAVQLGMCDAVLHMVMWYHRGWRWFVILLNIWYVAPQFWCMTEIWVASLWIMTMCGIIDVWQKFEWHHYELWQCLV